MKASVQLDILFLFIVVLGGGIFTLIRQSSPGSVRQVVLPTSLVFAREVSSQVAVIPTGKYNRFGHPRQETMDTLTEVLSEERILITPIQVNMELVSDGSRLRMKTER